MLQPASVSRPRPYALGIGRESFRQNARRRGTAATSCPQACRCQQEINRSSLSSTPESHLASNLGTLKDRLLRCRRFARGEESFQTSGLASTSSGRDCSPYWTSLSPVDSRRLWSPTETVLHDLDLTSCGTSCNVTEPLLQCSTLQVPRMLAGPQQGLPNLQMTSWQSLQFLQPDITEGEVTGDAEEEASRRCRKIRIYPTQAQANLLNEFARANRYFYNRANAKVKELIEQTKSARFEALRELKASDVTPQCVHHNPQTKARCTLPLDAESEWFCTEHKNGSGSLGISYAAFMSLDKLRPMVMKKDSQIPDTLSDGKTPHPDAWQKSVPFDTRQGAIKELIAAYKSAFALKKNGYISSFDIAFKRRKSPKQIIHCRANAFSEQKRTIFITRLKKGPRCKGAKLRVRSRDLTKLLPKDDEEGHGDFVVQKAGRDRWYICLPRKTKPLSKPVFENAAYKSVFIDPGVRTFATLYSPDGICGKIGDDFCAKHLDGLASKIDMFASMVDSKQHPSNFKQRLLTDTVRRMRQRIQALQAKIKHRVDQLHWKTCVLLCTSFQKIFIPKFGTNEMVRLKSPRGKRRSITAAVTRRMLELSHGRFLERLEYYARTKHREVYRVSEAYTTRTCGRCGKQNPNVGASKLFRCLDPECGYRMDRDIHGARNICLSTMSYMRQ